MDKARILIIDDDPDLRKTLADILMAKGYETFAAGDGMEGLALLEENPVNVALVDIGLPDLSGVDLLIRIKTERPSTEAIILTGNATIDSAIEATNRGAFSYLLKPYDIEQLLFQIQRALEKQQAEDRIVRHSAALEKSNAELKALQKISRTLSRTFDLDLLMSEILHALVDARIFPFEMKGTLSLLENGILRRASSIGLSETELETCGYISHGECLCGLAAEKGEVIVSRNSHLDRRHTVRNPGATPHGHVIVPMKSTGRVVGILSFYTPPDIEMNEETLAFLSSVGSQVGIDISNAQLYEETKSSALHDPLTGLANRRFMEIQLEKTIESARRYGKSFSVIMMDIDYFKQYNDTHGHLEGDRLLAKIAGIFLKDLRNADHVFRYGGEEFMAILTDTNLPMACVVAGRLRKAVEAKAGVTISLGVASNHKEVDDRESLIRSADEALYRAKVNGRNRVEAAPEEEINGNATFDRTPV